MLKDYFNTFYKNRDVLIHSIAWMVVSIVAAYPDFCINFKNDIFTTTTRNAYCNKFLLPIILFSLAFMLDFFFSIKDLSIGKKRGQLFKYVIIQLCITLFLFCLITVIPYTTAKIVLFILLWLNISLIKGVTVMIPGKDDVVPLKAPTTHIFDNVP